MLRNRHRGNIIVSGGRVDYAIYGTRISNAASHVMSSLILSDPIHGGYLKVTGRYDRFLPRYLDVNVNDLQ